ncbi:hypothetical protein PLESTB_000779600 [Pleodorina starrii]|uniref:Uncharacterized protein n=1 Tax=Pleodorina starrii TaxID=330485 RepID=A0A9W6F2Y1_9CHLO|nr:hypothetical protein PLESTM_000505100 [Pleodorina starrii]GLC53716.1 hypothetical protein PLESTB_000779600 [Pleodorina starrii]
MGAAQSGEEGIVTVVAPGARPATSFAPEDEEVLQGVEKQLTALGAQLRSFQLGPGAGPSAVPAAKAVSGAVAPTTAAAATAAALPPATAAASTSAAISGTSRHRTGSDEPPLLAAAVGPGAAGGGGTGSLSSWGVASGAAAVASSAAAVASGAAAVASSAAAVASGAAAVASGAAAVASGAVANSAAAVGGVAAAAFGGRDWLGLASYMSAGQTPQASADALQLSSDLQADIRTYRLWLRRREEEAARQQAALHRQLAEADVAARAVAARLGSATTSNTRLTGCLESQLGALARGVEALAGRVEAVSEQLAACGEVLGQRQGQAQGQEVEMEDKAAGLGGQEMEEREQGEGPLCGDEGVGGAGGDAVRGQLSQGEG